MAFPQQPHPLNRAERVLAFLLERPDVWIEATRFEPLGGRQAWRTAIAEARTLAKRDGRDIVNHSRRMTDPKGRIWVCSEYMLTSGPAEIPQDTPHNLNAFTPSVERGRLW